MSDRGNEHSVSGVILAGGKNTRMGTNKAFLVIDGERLIDRTVKLFKSIFPETIIVTNEPLEYIDHDAMIVSDIYRGKGPLGGIYTGLFWASASHVFAAACDMPFLNTSFIEYMSSRVDQYDIVVPLLKEGYQPLHAIYGKNCLAPMRKLMMQDRLKIVELYKGRRIITISEEITRTFDPEGRMFLNFNSPEDLAESFRVKSATEDNRNH